MYSLLIDAYVKDAKEKTYLFQAIQNIPCIAKKADWAFKWIERDARARTPSPDFSNFESPSRLDDPFLDDPPTRTFPSSPR